MFFFRSRDQPFRELHSHFKASVKKNTKDFGFSSLPFNSGCVFKKGSFFSEVKRVYHVHVGSHEKNSRLRRKKNEKIIFCFEEKLRNCCWKALMGKNLAKNILQKIFRSFFSRFKTRKGERTKKKHWESAKGCWKSFACSCESENSLASKKFYFSL